MPDPASLSPQSRSVEHSRRSCSTSGCCSVPLRRQAGSLALSKGGGAGRPSDRPFPAMALSCVPIRPRPFAWALLAGLARALPRWPSRVPPPRRMPPAASVRCPASRARVGPAAGMTVPTVPLAGPTLTVCHVPGRRVSSGLGRRRQMQSLFSSSS